MFGDLPGVETDISDILVWGLQRRNMMNILKLYYRGVKKSLTLNTEEKCKFGVTEVIHIGHVLSPEGVHPDPNKIKAIQNMPPPMDKKGIEQLLGTVNYLVNPLRTIGIFISTPKAQGFL